jgi:NAD(P)H dehydrogenase (quinone)
MDIAIIIHSVCGNTYLLGRAFKDELSALGHSVRFYRVADPLWQAREDVPALSREVLASFRSLPEAAPEHLNGAEWIMMGSPTYFGNVSAPMKTFMDQTGGLWFKSALFGKKFSAFTSAGNVEGGGDLCLQAFHTYAMYMGMLSLPMPVSLIKGVNVNPRGIIHCSSGQYAQSMDQAVIRQISSYCFFITSFLNKS